MIVLRGWRGLRGWFEALSLAQRFMLASLIILVAGMYTVGVWVETQIVDGVVHRTAATTAVYVDSIITPNLQELADGDTLTPMHVANLNRMLGRTGFGQDVAAFKVWSRAGRIDYSSDPTLTGQSFPVQGGLAQALGGEVAARISDLSDAENVGQRATDSRLLEMYTPVRLNGTDQVIGAAEFYYTVDGLEGDVAAAQWRTRLVVAATTVLMYLLLAVFVRGASNTIGAQRAELSRQVQRLTTLLAQNDELHGRVQRAAARATALNERFLRRVSAELHDGPAQDLGLALLRLDRVMQHQTQGVLTAPGGPATADGLGEDLAVVAGSLQRAMEEIRAISSGLGVPAMGRWTPAEIVSRVVSTHERRTGTRVAVVVECVADSMSLPAKITLYRLVQEALSNAYRHAGGAGQEVCVTCADAHLDVVVADAGPGFDTTAAVGVDHLGLTGMRERVESLGGVFTIESAPGQGTRVHAAVPLKAEGEDD